MMSLHTKLFITLCILLNMHNVLFGQTDKEIYDYLSVDTVITINHPIYHKSIVTAKENDYVYFVNYWFLFICFRS